MEVEEIRKKLQESQRSHLGEIEEEEEEEGEGEEEEELEHLGTIRVGEQKLDAVFTIEKSEIYKPRNHIHKLIEKIESTYQVTQIEINKRPRLQKLQNMFKIKSIMQTANKAMAEILDGKI